VKYLELSQGTSRLLVLFEQMSEKSNNTLAIIKFNEMLKLGKEKIKNLGT
jgi:ubiquinone/menaquinone biosynthesis C-methylase UbiE